MTTGIKPDSKPCANPVPNSIGLILVFFGLRIIVQSRRTVAKEVTLPLVAAQRKRAGTFTAPFMVLFGLFQFFTGLSGWNPDFDLAAREYVQATAALVEKYEPAEEPLIRPIRVWLNEGKVPQEEFDRAYEDVQTRMADIRARIELLTAPETEKGLKWKSELATFVEYEEGRIREYHSYMRDKIGTEASGTSTVMNETLSWLAKQEER